MYNRRRSPDLDALETQVVEIRETIDECTAVQNASKNKATKMDKKAAAAEKEALNRASFAVQYVISLSASEFLKSRGYTAGGKKKTSRKIPGL